MPRRRSAKILATLGPASASKDRIAALVAAGTNAFRLNFSHGRHADHAAIHAAVRAVEVEVAKPISVVMDLQGPKLRVGRFRDGGVDLVVGQPFRLDLGDQLGDRERVSLPHPEIFAALAPGTDLLLDDGRLRLRALSVAPDHAETEEQVEANLAHLQH